MIIYCENDADRVNKMNYLLTRMRQGFKYGVVSISQRKVKAFFKNETTAKNFTNFKGSEKIYKIIKLSELTFRLESDKGIAS